MMTADPKIIQRGIPTKLFLFNRFIVILFILQDTTIIADYQSFRPSLIRWILFNQLQALYVYIVSNQRKTISRKNRLELRHLQDTIVILRS